MTALCRGGVLPSCLARSNPIVHRPEQLVRVQSAASPNMAIDTTSTATLWATIQAAYARYAASLSAHHCFAPFVVPAPWKLALAARQTPEWSCCTTPSSTPTLSCACHPLSRKNPSTQPAGPTSAPSAPPHPTTHSCHTTPQCGCVTSPPPTRCYSTSSTWSTITCSSSPAPISSRKRCSHPTTGQPRMRCCRPCSQRDLRSSTLGRCRVPVSPTNMCRSCHCH